MAGLCKNTPLPVKKWALFLHCVRQQTLLSGLDVPFLSLWKVLSMPKIPGPRPGRIPALQLSLALLNNLRPNDKTMQMFSPGFLPNASATKSCSRHTHPGNRSKLSVLERHCTDAAHNHCCQLLMTTLWQYCGKSGFPFSTLLQHALGFLKECPELTLVTCFLLKLVPAPVK